MDQAIKDIIEQIWVTYDVDNSGALDKNETKKFMQEMVGNFSENGISDDDFEELFKNFDKDGSGTIDKDEMFTFMKSLLGEEVSELI